jgi:hypothetical protein
MPKVLKRKAQKDQPSKDKLAFPVDHYSASSFIKFSTNPILFKIEYINRDRFDTAMGASGILGKAFHKGMEVYYAGSDTLIPTNEEEAIEYGMKAGMELIELYNDGFINYTTNIPNKQKLFDLFTFTFQSYIKVMPYVPDTVLGVEEAMMEEIDVEWRGAQLKLPVKLKGYLDRVDRIDGKLRIRDYKTCYAYSNPDKIDGAKIIQAIIYYLLTYAKYGEEPYSLVFEEVKYSKNADGSTQVRQYEIVFAENELYFDFFFRFYEDITRALNGEQVYVPNVNALFDNEVAIIAYLHRLDDTEETAKLMKKHKVTNVSDLLKKQIQSAGNMRRLMKSIEATFVSAKNLDYDKMTNPEKIKTKLMEHGMMLQFEDLIEGATVDLYRFTPTIGLKMKKLESYTADVEQVLGVAGVRILAPIPGTSFVGFEVPRAVRSFPQLPAGGTFDIAIGETIMGEARRFDIRTAPHLLVAGASGSGKSVFLSGLIRQLSQIPNADLHLFDPKVVELAMHKTDANVVEYESDIVKISESLEGLISTMNARYEQMAKKGVRNIDAMPDLRYKFVIVDEFGDIIASQHIDTQTVKTGHTFTKGERAGEEETKTTTVNLSEAVERSILILAQKGRAAGIHVVIATQRPSTDVIKGTIKANFPAKVVFKTSKQVDSMVVLDEPGAEKLTGKGDMLFAGDTGIERLQGYNT